MVDAEAWFDPSVLDFCTKAFIVMELGNMFFWLIIVVQAQYEKHTLEKKLLK